MSSLLTVVSMSGLWDAGLKSAFVVLLAGVVAALLGRSSAARRHLVWCLCVASLLLLPVLALALPDWRVAWLPQWTAQPTRWTAEPTQVSAMELARAHRAEPFDEAALLDNTAPLEHAAIAVPAAAARLRTKPHQEQHLLLPGATEAASPPRSATPWLAITWLAGGLLSLVPLAIGLWQLAGLHRRSRVIGDDRWLTLLDRVRRQLAVRRRVQLRQCESALAPLTWGALRPVLLVPFEADAWPDRRRQLVLLHELAHVRRCDWLTQLIAHVVCAVYWFNPLVWWAARQMRIERERACDDIVLASGARASDYARELLALATGLSHAQVSTLLAVPMARRGALDDRIHGILDSGRSRASLSRASVCLGAALAAITLAPLAMLRATPPEPAETIAREPGTGDIQVTAKKPGVTQVNLFDENDNAYRVDVIIDPDARELENQPRSRNRLPEGDMENMLRLWKAGWRLFQHSQPTVVGAGELSVDQHHAGDASFHLSVEPRDIETHSPKIESSPLWLTSPALRVEAGQRVRIHGWVNIQRPIASSLDGLLIIESLGREPQAARVGVTNGWREFTLYREAPAACDLTITFALSGVGDAWIDDVTVELIAPSDTSAVAGAPPAAPRAAPPKKAESEIAEPKQKPPAAPAVELPRAERQVEEAGDELVGDPLTLHNPEVKEIWNLKIEVAVGIALANSKLLRNMSGLLSTPVVPQSKLKHAAGEGAKGWVPDASATAIRGTKVQFVLARANGDTTLANFQSGVRAMLSDVERAYWDLYYNYRNLSAVQAGRDSALATWRKICALQQQGLKGGEAENEKQAREQYFLFRAQAENTLGLLYTAESRLRYLMGVMPTDGRLIRPTDQPTTAEVRFDEKEILPEARNRNAGLSQDEEAESVRLLTSAVRDLDRNYQVNVTMHNRRVAAAAQVDAMQSAYHTGAATIDALLDAERRLADAEIAYWRALVDYNIAILQVHYRKNTLLEYNGILLTEGIQADADVSRK